MTKMCETKEKKYVKLKCSFNKLHGTGEVEILRIHGLASGKYYFMVFLEYMFV